MVSMEFDMRLIDMKQSELIELIKRTFSDSCRELFMNIESRMNEEPKEAKQPPLYGIEGLAQALYVSKATAQRMKNSGMLEGGYRQIGKTIIIEDTAKLREIAAEATKNGRAKGKGNRVNYSILQKHAKPSTAR